MPYVDPIPALKQRVAQIIVERLDGWSQVYAADFLGTNQPRMSNIRRGRLERFSLDQLVRHLAHIGGTLDLHVHWDPRKGFLAGR